MTDRAQFEAMLEALINEDQETAKELFHNIVVAKSREIYEELLEADFGKSEDEEDPEIRIPVFLREYEDKYCSIIQTYSPHINIKLDNLLCSN